MPSSTSLLSRVSETLRMIEVEHLDVRTVTLGLSLLDLAGSDSQLPTRIYDRISSYASRLVDTADAVAADLGVPIVNKRISVSPIALVAAGVEGPSPLKRRDPCS